MIFARIDSPVGPLLGAVAQDGVHALEFSEPERLEVHLAMLRKRFSIAAARTARADPAAPGAESDRSMLEQVRRELSEYFQGRRRSFDLPVRFAGTAFQEKVWRGLMGIGYGQTASYLELARCLGDEKALRAVGQANGRNPIVIIIPCHRVVGANGTLGGFGGGPWRKQFLLDLERGDRLL